MRKRFAFFGPLLLAGFILAAAGEAAARPDANSLIAAWEAALQSEESTEILQKTAERTYRFKTRLFPFDGELKVLNVLIDDFAEGEYLAGFASGSVEVELVGFSQEQMTRYARSYGYWYQLHTLFFDFKEGRWLTAKEYRVTAMARNPLPGGNSPVMSWLAQNYFLVIMALLAVFLWWLSKKSGRQVKSALSQQNEAMELTRRSFALSEKAVQLNEEANALLKEILQELKDGK
jgi:hypothetical protein